MRSFRTNQERVVYVRNLTYLLADVSFGVARNMNSVITVQSHTYPSLILLPSTRLYAYGDETLRNRVMYFLFFHFLSHFNDDKIASLQQHKFLLKYYNYWNSNKKLMYTIIIYILLIL